jgi:hypothetical protein
MFGPYHLDLGPVLAFLTPYLDVIVTTAIPLLMAWAAKSFNDWSKAHIKFANIQIQQSVIAQIDKAAEREAGVLIAASANNLAGQTFTTTSPVVALAVNHIASTLQDVFTSSGLTKDEVAHRVTAEIGKLQANTATFAPTASVVTNASTK